MSETSTNTTNSQRFDWQAVLNNWDVQAEQDKAEFLDVLYALYKPEDHTYTGLWERFKEDAAWTLRDYWSRDKTKLFVLAPDESKIETSTK